MLESRHMARRNNCLRQHRFQSMRRSQKKFHGLMPEGEEYDCESSTLFVRAVTTEVQIHDGKCYVTLPVHGHLT